MPTASPDAPTRARARAWGANAGRLRQRIPGRELAEEAFSVLRRWALQLIGFQADPCEYMPALRAAVSVADPVARQLAGADRTAFLQRIAGGAREAREQGADEDERKALSTLLRHGGRPNV